MGYELRVQVHRRRFGDAHRVLQGTVAQAVDPEGVQAGRDAAEEEPSPPVGYHRQVGAGAYNGSETDLRLYHGLLRIALTSDPSTRLPPATAALRLAAWMSADRVSEPDGSCPGWLDAVQVSDEVVEEPPDEIGVASDAVVNVGYDDQVEVLVGGYEGIGDL